MDTKFGHPSANRRNITHQAKLQTLDASRKDASDGRILQSIKPRGELRQWPYGEHKPSVIERLRNVERVGEAS